MKDKIKYTIVFPSKIAHKIKILANIEQVSKPEILRRAISLYIYIRKEMQAGKQLFLVNENGEKTKIEILF